MPKAAGIGTVVGLILAIVTFFIADGVSGPLEVNLPGQDGLVEVQVANVVVSTVIGGLVGLGLAALLRKFTASAAKLFLIICAVFLVLYTFGPFAAADKTSTAIWLNVMHVVVAVPVVGMLWQTLGGDVDTPSV